MISQKLMKNRHVAKYNLCIGYSVTYQLQNKMILQAMNRQRVHSIDR